LKGYQRNSVREGSEMVNPSPVIGLWYVRSGGEAFEVVALDREDRTIEIQYFDGTVEELDLDEWREEEIRTTEAPEDWTGSVDVDAEDTENEYEREPGGGAARGDAMSFVDRGEAGGFAEIELPEPDEF
jgi:hypothetical protein